MIPEFVSKLDVFQKAYRQSLEIHQMVSSFPAEERFELVSQI